MARRGIQGSETVQLSISFPVKIINEIDQCDEGMLVVNRSEVIRRAVRYFLNAQARKRRDAHFRGREAA